MLRLRQVFDDAIAELAKNDVLSYRLVSGNMRLQVQSPLWYRSPAQVLVNGAAQSVLSVQKIGCWTFITLNGPNPPAPVTWSPLLPLGIVGTAKDVNVRLHNSNNGEPYPFIWLLTPFVEESTEDDQSYSSHDVRLFFLTSCADDQTADTTENVAQMDDLANAFLRALERVQGFSRYRNLTKVAHVKFGQQADGGAQQSILDSILCGVEIRITLEIFNNCC